MYSFIKTKEPEFIASRKDFLVDGRKTGWVEEEWYTSDIAVPEWWNEECHRLVETKTVGGNGFIKFCLICDKQVSENGCKHNINAKDK